MTPAQPAPADRHRPDRPAGTAAREPDWDTQQVTVDFLATTPLFGGLVPAQVAALASWVQQRSFPPGEMVIRQGDLGEGLYLIVEGYAEVMVDAERSPAQSPTESPEEIGAGAIPTHLALLGPGEPFGEMSLLDDQPIIASVVAASRLRCLYLPKGEFLRALKGYAPVAAAVVDMLVRRLRDADRRLASAASDPLTGLANRLGLERQCWREGARLARHGGSLAMLFADVDDFKQINDTHGHPVGDQVLRIVADTLRRGLRASDYLARYGGDEFVALLPDTTQQEAHLLADRLSRDLTARADMPVPVRVSLGVRDLHAPAAGDPGAVEFAVPEEALDQHAGVIYQRLSQLLAAADRAMYVSKARHRAAVASRTQSPA